MKLQYLGTAAAEAIPAIFCRCEICQNARQVMGKEIRGRSGMVINDDLLIDFPPDVYLQTAYRGIDLSRIENVIVTHSHADHFAPNELVLRFDGLYCYLNGAKPVLDVFGNHAVKKRLIQAEVNEYGKEIDFLHFTEVEKFRTYEIGQYQVTPLPALHALSESAYIYLVADSSGKTLLYAHDTGIFFDEVFDYLKTRHTTLDVASLDCTVGKKRDGKNHMGLSDAAEVADRLQKQGNADEKTRFLINHFSHNGGMTHTELCEAAEAYGFDVAFDGKIIIV